jgi:hypothetical protein
MAFHAPIPYVPCVQIRNSAIVLYYTPIEKLPRSKNQFKSFDEIKAAYSGEISKSSRKNISRAINLLVQSSPLKWYINPITKKRNHHRLTFLTLTIPSEPKIKLNESYSEFLKKLLRWLVESKKVKNYVWKAEYQKNGQLHYHITTNEFVRYDELKSKWNSILRNNEKFGEFYREKNKLEFNNTDIHAVYKIQDIESYLIKYMNKESGSSGDKGKVWGCSENLRGKQYFTIFNADDFLLDAIHNDEKNGNLRRIESIVECSFWKINNKKDFEDLFNKKTTQIIKNYALSEFKKTDEYLNNQNI